MPAETLNKIAFDIETRPIREGGNALNPEESQVESAGFWGEDAQNRPVREVLHVADFFGDERELLVAISARVIGFGTVELVGWNSSGFDLPFLDYRYRENHLTTIGPVISPTGEIGKYGNPEFDGTWQHASHRDIYREWRQYADALGIRNSLKPIARAAGLAPVEIDTTRLSDYTRDEVGAYQLSDVRCTYELDAIPVQERATRLGIEAA